MAEQADGYGPPVDHSDRWRRLMALDPSHLRVADAVAVIDSVRTGIDPDETLARLDQMAATCPGGGFDEVHRHLFSTLGFGGDLDHYHHERNSLLSSVLDRRRGLPILVAVVTSDVAAQRDVSLLPVGMPGHFLLRHDGDPPTFIDAFGGGTLLDVAGCEALFRRTNGPSPRFTASMLAPTAPHDVVVRVLNNLKGTYSATGDLANLRWVLELRAGVPGVPDAEAFERAAVLDELGRHDDAADVLDDLARRTDGQVAAAAAHRSRALRARNN